MKKIIFMGAICTMFFMFACQKEEVNINVKEPTDAEVSENLATKIALNFTKTKTFWANGEKNLKNGITDNFLQREIKKVYSLVDDEGKPALYIINFKPDGFVIISATMKEEPILAYSSSNKFDFDNIPDGLQFWLDVRVDRIKKIKKLDIEVPQEIANAWEMMVGDPDWTDPETGDPDPEPIPGGAGYYKENVLPLTSKWGQRIRFNSLLDTIFIYEPRTGRLVNSGLPPAGCVAIAMGQIMKYYQYPTNYNWANMFNLSATTESAQLIKDIGIAVDMKYGIDGSGTNTETKVPPAFRAFGYSSSVRYSNYTSDIVKAEIDANRPIIMKGGTQKIWLGFIPYYTDGHAWVCHGYKEESSSGYWKFYMMMNWGWYGDHDGWYSYSNFNNPNGTYNYQVGLIIGIKP